jgi:hypothetical protein
MKKIFVLLFICFLISNYLDAQVTIDTNVSINKDGTLPHNSAMLDVQSNTKGILIPKMTLAERDNISSPAQGLLIYCTDDNRFHYNKGPSDSPVWINLGLVDTVGLALPAGEFQVSDPVTNSGTLTGSWKSQNANLLFASPVAGTGTPSFRSLVDDDIPDGITTSGYLLISGGSLSGKLNTNTSSTASAGLKLPHGTAPDTPENGDLWTTTLGLYARINNTTVGPFGTGNGNGTVTSVEAQSPLFSTGGSTPVISLNEVVGVTKGGTGVNNLTSNKILVGNGTGIVLLPDNLHWDNTNGRLGVGNPSPAYTLDVTGNINVSGGIRDEWIE